MDRPEPTALEIQQLIIYLQQLQEGILCGCFERRREQNSTTADSENLITLVDYPVNLEDVRTMKLYLQHLASIRPRTGHGKFGV